MVYRFTQMSRQEVEVMLGLRLQDTRVYQEAKEEGREEGREEGWVQERSLVLRLLTRKVGDLSDAMIAAIQALPIEQVEDLGEALLEFDELADMEQWLQQRRSPNS